MHEPKLLILDEPTSGLDPIMQQVFYDILQEEKEKGTTIFYSTHILNEISKICDRVGIIKDGSLLKVETIEELKNRNLTIVTIESNEIKEIAKELKLGSSKINETTIKFNNQKEQQNTPTQEQANQQLVMQLLPELLKNPEGLKTLMEIGTKYSNKK